MPAVVAKLVRDTDYPLVFLTLCLIAMGVAVIFGLASDTLQYSGLWRRQLVFAALGFGLMLAVSLIDYRKLLSLSLPFYAVTVVMLVLTAIMGVEKNGAKSWLHVPGLPIDLQTSEFAKMGVIFMLTWVLARFEGKLPALWIVAIPGILVAIPLVLVLKQPDLGTAIVFVPVTLGMVLLAGLPAALVALLLSPALAFLAVAAQMAEVGWIYVFFWVVATAGIFAWAWIDHAPRIEIFAMTALNVIVFCGVWYYGTTMWNLLEPHQQSRILVYMNPEYDPAGAGWQVEQSKIAIGSGGLVGKGIGKGTQSHLNFLAETPTDFVFAVLAEEWGFVGGSLLVLLFGLLLLRGIDVSRAASELDGTLLAGGIVLLFLTHLSINVGMTMGLIPVTGLPLTFISYGGSALLTNMVAVGLLLSVHRHRKQE